MMNAPLCTLEKFTIICFDWPILTSKMFMKVISSNQSGVLIVGNFKANLNNCLLLITTVAVMRLKRICVQ